MRFQKSFRIFIIACGMFLGVAFIFLPMSAPQADPVCDYSGHWRSAAVPYPLELKRISGGDNRLYEAVFIMGARIGLFTHHNVPDQTDLSVVSGFMDLPGATIIFGLSGKDCDRLEGAVSRINKTGEIKHFDAVAYLRSETVQQ